MTRRIGKAAWSVLVILAWLSAVAVVVVTASGCIYVREVRVLEIDGTARQPSNAATQPTQPNAFERFLNTWRN